MRSDGEESPSFWSLVGELSSLALTLALCVFIGFLAGRWLGRRFGSEDVGVLVGLAVGITAAGVELARGVQRLKRLGTPPRKNSHDP